MDKIKKAIEILNRGEVPDELNFSPQLFSNIDFGKLQYNSYYRSKCFVYRRYPFLDYLPGGDEMAEIICEQLLSPLEEIEERQKETEKKQVIDGASEE